MIPKLGSAWVDMVRSLGQGLLEVLQAETEVLGQELGRTGKQAGIGMALVAASAMISFWFLGVATLCVVAILALWMPTWAAAGVVGLVLLLTAAVLAGLAWSRFKSLENPAMTLQRRWVDHQAWWHGRLLASGEVDPGDQALGGPDVNALEEEGSEGSE